MKKTCCITIDLGSSSCKTTLFNLKGQILSRVDQSYETYYPQKSWAEQNPDDWWKIVIRSIREILEKSSIDKKTVRAIGVTGQMHSFVPVDGNGKAVFPCMTLLDRRSIQECKKIKSRIGDKRMYEITGARLFPTVTAPKILWFKDNCPELYRRTSFFLAPKDYIRFKLTGNIATDPIDAAGTLLYNIVDRKWSDEMLDATGVSRRKLPSIKEGTHIAGKLKKEVSRITGLSEDISVIIGGGDEIATLGIGVTEPGDVYEHLGTTGAILVCTNELRIDPDMRVELYPHPVKGRWLIGGATATMGAALNWYVKNFLEDTFIKKGGSGFCKLLDDLAMRHDKRNSELLFLPFLAGERAPLWDYNAKGAIVGMTLKHSRADLAYALYKGLSFSLYSILKVIEELELLINQVYTSGSGAQSSFWRQLRANIYGKRIYYPVRFEGAALATLIMIGKALGVFSSLSEKAKSLIEIRDTSIPDNHLYSQHQKSYDFYNETYSQLKSLFNKL